VANMSDLGTTLF